MFCVLHRKTQKSIAMCSLHAKGVFIFLFLHVMMSFGEQNLNSDADIINTCVDTTWCSHSYEQVYKSLAKAENNFNISHALYPGRSKPTSVRVLVSVFVSHKTNASKPALYTWSMSCLFVSVPAAFLEFLSLGSILVTPRTQELTIRVPQFCCNVLESREGRKKIIDEILTRALAELQDLAISPGIQDPRLNTAECVIQGHQPNIDATGVNSYIRAILYCSFFSVLLIGPILGFFSLNYFEDHLTEKDKFYEYNIKGCAKRAPAQDPSNILCVACYKVENTYVRSAEYTCVLLLLTDILITLIVVRDVLFDHTEIYIPIILIACICEGVVICLVQCCAVLCCGFCKDICKETSLYRRFVFMTSANIIAYHAIWLIVGIMVNPAWGLTILAVACFIIVALFFTIYVICNAPSKESFCHSFCVSIASFVGLCLVVSLTVLAGQSFYGKETTGEILKTALLYVVGGLTWLFRKGYLDSSSSKDRAAKTDNEIELGEMQKAASNAEGKGTGEAVEEEERKLLQGRS